MRAKGTLDRMESAAGFNPENTAVLGAEDTFRLLALPVDAAQQTPAQLGVEALHRATFVQLPMGVGYAARDGTFIWCNEASIECWISSPANISEIRAVT